ncbi:Pentatricopeptide repeat-containing protein At5g52850, chloroplastic [Linum perenne]
MTSKAASCMLNGVTDLRYCLELEEILAQVVSFCSLRSLKEGICVHAPLIKLSLHDHLYLNNNLLSLYGKCFGLKNARQLFDEMPQRDVVSWSGMLSSYTKSGNHETTLDVYREMEASGTYPNAFTFSSVLRSCAALSDLEFGKRVHGSLVKHGLQSNPVLGSSLIELYSRVDSHDDMDKVFGLIDDGDVVSWTAMISSSVHAGKMNGALKLYIKMINGGISPNGFTFPKVLTACGALGLELGKIVHSHVVVHGAELNLVMKTSLVDMYSKSRMMEDSVKVMKLTPESDAFLWTRIITGFAHGLKFEEAFAAFRDMRIDGVSPNEVTYLVLLTECVSNSLDFGRQIHSRVIVAGFEDVEAISNALLDMYLKCSDMIEDGLRVFREMESVSVVSWTSLIAGFAAHGRDSLGLYKQMRAAGMEPATHTLSILLKSSSSQTLIQLHTHVIKANFGHDIFVGNSLVDAYAGSGRFDDSWRVVRAMNRRDVITYTSFATRLNQSGHHRRALEIVNHMVNDGVEMDSFSLATFLSASSYLATQETGQQLHCRALKSGLVSSISVMNALVDFYGRQRHLHDAKRAFSEIECPDVVSWNGLMCGLASMGRIDEALSSFDEMRMNGVAPDSVTFLSVLFACQQGGLVDRSREYFVLFKEQCDLEPKLEHYGCLIDTISKAGRLEEAIEVLEAMPLKANGSIYKTMLAACRVHKNLRLGEDMARRGLEVCPDDPVFYVWLTKLYDECGRPDLAEQTRKSKRDRFSWVEPGGLEEHDCSFVPEMRRVVLGCS